MTAAAGSMVCKVHTAIAQFAMDLIVIACTVQPSLFQVKHSN